MRRESAKGPSQRQLRVSEEIRHVLARMLAQNDLFIEDLRPSYLMITEVRIAPDLSAATAFIRGIGDVDTKEQVRILNAHKGPFRYHIGKTIKLRIVPTVLFKEDDSFDTVAHIADLLSSPIVKADIEKYKEEETVCEDEACKKEVQKNADKM